MATKFNTCLIHEYNYQFERGPSFPTRIVIEGTCTTLEDYREHFKSYLRAIGFSDKSIMELFNEDEV
jgi:hypothetical protein